MNTLKSLGISALGLPVIERAFQPIEWPPETNILAVVTSRAVAERLPPIKGLMEHQPVRRPRESGGPLPVQRSLHGPRIACLAPGTLEALTSRQFPVDIAATGGVVALAHKILEHRDHLRDIDHIWYPSSDVAGEHPSHLEAVALLSQLAPVNCEVVYSVRPNEHLTERLTSLPENWGLVFFSPSAVSAFSEHADTAIPQAVVAVGASTAAACHALEHRGWPAAKALGTDVPWISSFSKLVST